MIYAKYTIVLKTLLDDPKSKSMIDSAMATYPLHLPKNPAGFSVIPTREEINKKILDYYKYREIGFETFGRFLDELEIALNEIMPYYNQLFNSEDIINGLDDIFGNLDVTDTYERETSGSTSNTSEVSESGTLKGKDTSTSSATNTNDTSDETETTSSVDSTSKDVKSQTPQDSLTITASKIESVSYADEVNWNKGNTTSSGTSSGSAHSEGTTTGNSEVNKDETSTKTGNTTDTGTSEGSETYTLHRKGNQGVNTYAHDMLEFRQLFMNVIQKIIHDPRISELFMIVY